MDEGTEGAKRDQGRRQETKMNEVKIIFMSGKKNLG